ncbi:MAG: dihydrofolate reductase [Atopostipes suicloacalis]|nr:dihydrofolate reductase [Atopostipes suicloacalis]
MSQLDKSKLSIKEPYFTFVWAEDEDGLIGSAGELPWHLPGEMKHFVEVTKGDIVIMGRKSYESIPNPPLRNRLNIVLTRNENYQAKGAVICHSKEAVLDYLKENDDQKAIHVIGGNTIFKLFIDEVDLLYRTVIHERFDGETYMPKLNYDNFRLIDQAAGLVDERNEYSHTFYLYERKNNQSG